MKCRQWTPVVLSGLLLAGALCAPMACAPSAGSSTEIKFWAMGSEGEHVGKLLTEFHRKNPSITVRLQVIPWTAAHEKLLTAYAGNSMPDVCQLGNTWIPEFVILKAIEPLTARIASSSVIHKEGYFSGIWDTNTIDGVQYGVPWYVDTRVVFYRKDILKRAGVDRFPRTWEEWRTACDAVVKRGRAQETYALLLPTNEWAPAVILGLQAGSPLLKDRDTRGDFAGQPFLRAFDFYIDFFRNKHAPIGVTRVQNLYQGLSEEFFAMYISGPWNIGEFRRRLPDELQDDWMTAPIPGPAEGIPGVSLAGGSSLVMFRASKHPDAVWKLIEFLSEPVQQVAFYQHTGDLPARTEAWRDTALANNTFARAFYEQLAHVVPTPKIPEWEQIAMKLQDYAEAAARNVATPQQAMQDLDRDVNRILEKRRWMLYGDE